MKVTYLPANYVKRKRKEANLQDELAELKSAARKNGIPFDSTAKPGNIAYEITERIKTSDSGQCLKVLEKQRGFRKKLIAACKRNPKELLTNLYEEQGEMRFDASNRLFMILADTAEFENSWKLKRDPDFCKSISNLILTIFPQNRQEEKR